jgi:iron complex outermembrane receptor protein
MWNERSRKTRLRHCRYSSGPDAGNGNLLDTISIDATNQFNPWGVTLRGDDR